MTESLFKGEERARGAVRYLRVAVERSVDHPDGLTYSAPIELAGLQVGDRVEAPLGRGNAPAAGYVVEIDIEPDLDPARIKPIRRRIGAGLPARLVELARWMARYYVCPLGMALGAMTPGAVKRRTGEVTRIELERNAEVSEADAASLSPSALSAWERISGIDAERFPIAARTLADLAGCPTLGPINRLVRAGLLREVRIRRVRAAWPGLAMEQPTVPELTREQAGAVEAIGRTAGSFAVHLLRGVTGSGKTEVYLRALEGVVERGGSAIVLVPEISLTPQTAGRFLSRFAAAGVAVLHSGLTAAQRNQQWTACEEGTARIVIGARSSIFAPLRAPLGLVVVDEEHDHAYKQEEPLPRYHARDVAIKRAQIEGCPVVLGSATPSLESWLHATRGRYELHVLPTRVAGASLPRVEVVDLAAELRSRDERSVSLIGPRLESALVETLASGGQAMILLNRRGYANYICCPDHRCGWLMSCERCDALMVYHRDRSLPTGGFVRCHHCESELRLPGVCPTCGKKVNTFGMGTQRVEEELQRRFPELVPGETLLRLDGDTVDSARGWHESLARFASGEVRVLLGTQMIAKGHDFPNVRLVGIVNADTSINMPDFRSGERTFQLVSQVAGRAGRTAAGPGRVIVQSFGPDNPAIRLAASHDFPGFARQELAMRERAGLPPFARMARIVTRDEDLAEANASARRIAEALRDAADRSVRVRGPMPCPLSRVNGMHRVGVELLAPSVGPLQSALTAVRNDGLLKSDARTAVDVDPVAML